ncbi:MAG: helix-turn-helix domain-containing protein [Elusimicrobiota bacterium]|jgi:DNA-binding Xre family transcriptional regulator
MKPKRILFSAYLKKQLKSPLFRKAFEKEDLRSRLAVSIALLRQGKHLSQKGLAERIHASQQMVSDIETGKQSNLTVATLQRIAAALDRRLVILFR